MWLKYISFVILLNRSDISFKLQVIYGCNMNMSRRKLNWRQVIPWVEMMNETMEQEPNQDYIRTEQDSIRTQYDHAQTDL